MAGGETQYLGGAKEKLGVQNSGNYSMFYNKIL
jgi:hypothetical protein